MWQTIKLESNQTLSQIKNKSPNLVLLWLDSRPIFIAPSTPKILGYNFVSLKKSSQKQQNTCVKTSTIFNTRKALPQRRMSLLYPLWTSVAIKNRSVLASTKILPFSVQEEEQIGKYKTKICLGGLFCLLNSK